MLTNIRYFNKISVNAIKMPEGSCVRVCTIKIQNELKTEVSKLIQSLKKLCMHFLETIPIDSNGTHLPTPRFHRRKMSTHALQKMTRDRFRAMSLAQCENAREMLFR